MVTPIKIENSETEVLIETPTNPTDKVAIFLPGISGDAFSDRFMSIAKACIGVGFAIARVSAWNNIQDVEKKNLSQIYNDINTIITLLQNSGYVSIFGIGKSFGGMIMLTLPSQNIKAKVLWAPAIGIAESDSNIDTYLSTPLGSLESLLDMKVNRAFLEKIEIPILIIHGTVDDNVPLSNSEQLVSILPNAKLVAIKGADHSYRTREHEDAVIKTTMDFLVTSD